MSTRSLLLTIKSFRPCINVTTSIQNGCETKTRKRSEGKITSNFLTLPLVCKRNEKEELREGGRKKQEATLRTC